MSSQPVLSRFMKETLNWMIQLKLGRNTSSETDGFKWDTKGRIARGFPPVVGKKPLPLRGTINVDRVVVRL